MEWSDEAFILGTRKHGEGSVIVEVMTPSHGRHMGMVRGGRSSRMRPLLQAGNSVSLTWRARLDEHLGSFAIEAETLRAARLMETPLALAGLQLVAAHLRLLPERDPHPSLYHSALVVLDHLDAPEKAALLMVRFELQVLEELGFGLDLSECAATGSMGDLVYVSPKSGRAVSRQAGEPWRARLLPLPAFLAPPEVSAATSLERQIVDGLSLSGHFLGRNVWEPRGLRPPESRERFVTVVGRFIQPNIESTKPAT
jgi:DNA repair protein RecO (recombination protein O)